MYESFPGNTDGHVLAYDDQFQVFVAVDRGQGVVNGVNTDHDVILYGGEWWGFKYSNADVVPVPSAVWSGLSVLGAMASWAVRRNRVPRVT